MTDTPDTEPPAKKKDDDKLPPQFSFIEKLEGMMGKDNPLLVFLTGIISMLKMLFGGDKEDPAQSQDLRGTEREQRAAIERDQQEHKKAEAGHTTLKDSLRRVLTPSTVATLPNRLEEIRKEEELKRGGKHLEAIMPVASDGRITEEKGHRHAPTKGATTEHQGLDIASDTPGKKPDIIAAMPGVVVAAGHMEGYGNTVIVQDIYGKFHRYGHLDSISVREGQEVQQAEKLGVMGMSGRATGVHLHYEQRDEKNNPIEPRLMGKNKWHEGEKFALNDIMQLVESQKNGAVTVAAAPPEKTGYSALASMDLSSVSEGGKSTYIAPGAKPAGSQKGIT